VGVTAVVGDPLVVLDIDGEAEDVLDGWAEPVIDADAVVVLERVTDLETEGLADTVFVELIVAVVVLVALMLIVARLDGVNDHDLGGETVAPAVAEDVLEELALRVDSWDWKPVVDRMSEAVLSQVSLIDLVPVVVRVDVLDWVGDCVVKMPLLVACVSAKPIINRRKRFMSPYTIWIDLRIL